MEQVLTYRIQKDGEWFTGSCDEVPGANGQGRTLSSCASSLSQAVALVLDDRDGVVTTSSFVDVQTSGGSKTFPVELICSHEGYAIGVPAMPGCWSQGETEAEAMENIVSAILDYLEVAAERGRNQLHKVA